MDLQTLENEALQEIGQATELAQIDALTIKYLGRKEGSLNKILRQLGDLTPEDRKTVGQSANRLKNVIEAELEKKRASFHAHQIESQIRKTSSDITLPGLTTPRGHPHPILQTIRDISRIFERLGFVAADGPEIETDENNFTLLNIPQNHPARDLQDTFYLPKMGKETSPWVLRTHTSPVQIRVMKQMKPPVRIIAPGRVYRHEAVDATHAAIFHQIEGLAVDKGITFGDLKGTLKFFAQEYFGQETKVRFRPSYFPFVEPGAEMDLSCFACHGSCQTAQGTPCPLCKGTGWIEMLGAGMVHPQVLRNVKIDPDVYSGFAFGMGIERIVMTRMHVTDIRYFLESDLRFLEQF